MATKKAASASVYPGDEEWRAQDDMRTLMTAMEIKADPKRLAAAKAQAKKKLSEMQAVVDLKK